MWLPLLCLRVLWGHAHSRNPARSRSGIQTLSVEPPACTVTAALQSGEPSFQTIQGASVSVGEREGGKAGKKNVPLFLWLQGEKGTSQHLALHREMLSDAHIQTGMKMSPWWSRVATAHSMTQSFHMLVEHVQKNTQETNKYSGDKNETGPALRTIYLFLNKMKPLLMVFSLTV